MKWMVLLLTFVATSACAQVRIDDPWTRATPPGAKVGAGYMKITSPAADRLIGASSPAAARVELHVTEKKGDVMRMREVNSLPLTPGQAVELKPGSYHFMLMDLKAQFKPDVRVPLTLRFRDAKGAERTTTVSLPVAMGAPMQHKH